MTAFDIQTMLDAWELNAATCDDPAEARGIQRCARELRDLLRYSDTIPAPVSVTDPAPPMRWPSDLPREEA